MRIEEESMLASLRQGTSWRGIGSGHEVGEIKISHKISLTFRAPNNSTISYPKNRIMNAVLLLPLFVSPEQHENKMLVSLCTLNILAFQAYDA